MQSPKLALPLLAWPVFANGPPLCISANSKHLRPARQAASTQAKLNRCSQRAGQTFASFAHVRAARAQIPTARPGDPSRLFTCSTLTAQHLPPGGSSRRQLSLCQGSRGPQQLPQLLRGLSVRCLGADTGYRNLQRTMSLLPPSIPFSRNCPAHQTI